MHTGFLCLSAQSRWKPAPRRHASITCNVKRGPPAPPGPRTRTPRGPEVWPEPQGSDAQPVPWPTLPPRKGRAKASSTGPKPVTE